MVICSKCGKSWPENYCPECGRTIEQAAGAPPVIAQAPPLIGETPPFRPAAKRSRPNGLVIVLILAGLVFFGFLGFRVVQFAWYARAHPGQTQPGELEFRNANKEIIAGNIGEVFGNNDAARALAKEYSKSLKILRDNFFSKGGHTALGALEGNFLTYCQLNDASCVFLVHVPELREFTGDAKQSMADLAWINAQSVLQTATKNPPRTVVVGVKGLMLYDAILIGDYVADPKPGKDGIVTRGSGLTDMKLFYPYFAPPAASTNLPTISPAQSSSSSPDVGAGNADITVQSARFGRGGNVADVTATVIQLLSSQPDGFVVNAQTMGADPLPGKKKHLTIHYEYKGSACVLTIEAGKQMSHQSLAENARK